MIDFAEYVGATVNIGAQLGDMPRCEYEAVEVTGETPNLVMVKVDGEIEGVLKDTIITVEVLKPADPAKVKKAAEKVAKAKAPKVAKDPKAPKAEKGPTKKDQVIALRIAHPEATRKEAIALMVEQIGMTPAGASTYYQSVWKAS